MRQKERDLKIQEAKSMSRQFRNYLRWKKKSMTLKNYYNFEKEYYTVRSRERSIKFRYKWSIIKPSYEHLFMNIKHPSSSNENKKFEIC